jgi:hypothetical protein
MQLLVKEALDNFEEPASSTYSCQDESSVDETKDKEDQFIKVSTEYLEDQDK